jgi:hypothetical protein
MVPTLPPLVNTASWPYSRSLSAPSEQYVFPTLPPLVLYVSVSDALAQTLAANGVPPTATGQRLVEPGYWALQEEDWLAASLGPSCLDTGVAAPDAVMLKVHISPAGWEHLVRRRLLFPPAYEGACFRYHGVLHAVMKDDQGQLLVHCEVDRHLVHSCQGHG